MTNFHRSRLRPRTALRLRRTGILQLIVFGLVIGLFGVATACSLENFDYLSTDLKNQDCSSGGDASATISTAGTTAATASGG
jgi:hypothetical protein